MPKFLEKRLKAEYGEGSDIPFKIMNKLGFMRGNKETAKGRAAAKKHASHKDKTTPHGAREVEKESKIIHQGRLDEKLKGFMIEKMRGYEKGKRHAG